MQTQEILHLSSTASPTSELSSKARLPYARITGYATTPPHSLHALQLAGADASRRTSSEKSTRNVTPLVVRHIP